MIVSIFKKVTETTNPFNRDVFFTRKMRKTPKGTTPGRYFRGVILTRAKDPDLISILLGFFIQDYL